MHYGLNKLFMLLNIKEGKYESRETWAASFSSMTVSFHMCARIYASGVFSLSSTSVHYIDDERSRPNLVTPEGDKGPRDVDESSTGLSVGGCSPAGSIPATADMLSLYGTMDGK